MTLHDDLATLRRETERIRTSIGFALAEKNIPREPTWTLLTPQALDNIGEAADRLEAHIATLEQERDKLRKLNSELTRDYNAMLIEESKQRTAKEAAEAALAAAQERAATWEAKAQNLAAQRGDAEAALADERRWIENAAEVNRSLNTKLADARRALAACGKHLEDCCRSDIGWREQMASHDDACRALVAAGQPSAAGDSGLGRDEYGGTFEGEAPE